MTHDEIFGEYKQKENVSSEEFVVYEWVGKQLYKKTFTRRYWPGALNEAADSYTSEAIV